MNDSDPRQDAEMDNRKSSNAQDLEMQMTAVDSSPPEFINPTFRAEEVTSVKDIHYNKYRYSTH